MVDLLCVDRGKGGERERERERASNSTVNDHSVSDHSPRSTASH